MTVEENKNRAVQAMGVQQRHRRRRYIRYMQASSIGVEQRGEAVTIASCQLVEEGQLGAGQELAAWVAVGEVVSVQGVSGDQARRRYSSRLARAAVRTCQYHLCLGVTRWMPSAAYLSGRLASCLERASTMRLLPCVRFVPSGESKVGHVGVDRLYKRDKDSTLVITVYLMVSQRKNLRESAASTF